MNIADLLTLGRIVCATVMLCLPAASNAFGALYLLGGATDMLDGAVARKTHTASAAGAKLDSIADICFIAVCVPKLLPLRRLPVWLWLTIALILCLRLSGMIRRRSALLPHTALNRLTGLLLFLTPIAAAWIDIRIAAAPVCLCALAAALRDLMP